MEITLILIPLMIITKCCRGEILTEGQRYVVGALFMIFIFIEIIMTTSNLTMIMITFIIITLMIMINCCTRETWRDPS